MPSMPKSVTTLSDKQCRDIVTKVQEILWLDADVIHEDTPIQYWNSKSKRNPGDTLMSIAEVLVSAGLRPKD